MEAGRESIWEVEARRGREGMWESGDCEWRTGYAKGGRLGRGLWEGVESHLFVAFARGEVDYELRFYAGGEREVELGACARRDQTSELSRAGREGREGDGNKVRGERAMRSIGREVAKLQEMQAVATCLALTELL